MKCPLCDSKLRVIDSRMDKRDSSVISRKRECVECLSRFETIERINYVKCDPYVRERLHYRLGKELYLSN